MELKERNESLELFEMEVEKSDRLFKSNQKFEIFVSKNFRYFAGNLGK